MNHAYKNHVLRARRKAAATATTALVGVLVVFAAPGIAFGSAGGNGNGNANGLAKKSVTAPAVTAPAVTVTAPAVAPVGGAVTSGDLLPQPCSNADLNGTGANQCNSSNQYLSTRDGSPSLNGNGNGTATGKPCAGCVGKADNKNPPGQFANGSDHNAGYECDRNHGIGRSNPAHTGCAPTSGTTTTTTLDPCQTGSCGVTTTTLDPCQTGSCGVTTTTLDPCQTGSCGTTTPSCGPANSAQCSPPTDPGVTPAVSCTTTMTGSTSAQVCTPAVSKAPAAPSHGSLAFTGANLGAELGAAFALLLLGTGATLATRRRRSS